MNLPNDEQYELTSLEDFTKLPDGYELKLEDGCFLMPGHTVTPKVGDEVRLYGKGAGYQVRGLSVGGELVFYRTEEEQDLENERSMRRQDEEALERYKANLVRTEQRIGRLPSVFQERIMAFRANDNDWAHKYEGYELGTCELAVALSKTLKTVESLQEFRDLPHEEQERLVPAISEGHSGNTMGCAMGLAYTYLTKKQNIPLMHGAMCPLVGCKAYGCYASRIPPYARGGVSTSWV